jgi:hypothetical protein
MKKFCFLVQCLDHSNDLSGKLAILTTDNLKVGHIKREDASRFTPGTFISWVPLTNGSCSAMIIADLRLAGYSNSVHKKHMLTLRDVPPEWIEPDQFLEVREMYISE